MILPATGIQIILATLILTATMCVLDMPQCGGGDPGIFTAPQYSSTLTFGNIRRCSTNSIPSMNPLNCGSFRIRHGYEPNVQDCAACTQALKSAPPPQLRQQASPPLPVEPGRYDDGPLAPRANPRSHADDDLFLPGLSNWAPAPDEASVPAYCAGQEAYLANFPPGVRLPTNVPIMPDNVPHWGPPPSAVPQRPTQSTSRMGPSRPTNILYHLPQRASTLTAQPWSRSQHCNENQVAELTKLLNEQLDCNQELTRENEELKKENEELKSENTNLKSWVAQNGPMYH